MAFLFVVYVLSFIAFLVGWLPIAWYWFILGPILFIPTLILFCFLIGAGFFTTVAGFFGIATLGEKMLDYFDLNKRSEKGFKNRTPREIFEERKKWK